jgi:hypothetical protein
VQYTGESMNPDGMIALLNYRVRFPDPRDDSHCSSNYFSLSQEDGITRTLLILSWFRFIVQLNLNSIVAYFTFWKDGLKEVKL